ncbi:ATP-binding protein [Microtetraspora sp. NBRC 13810]|uniref:sensor histidine kinase n=1 Tax=Microtetraspora sp. NBRC 13810 TaxID=3030990 RepID=UPI00255443AA|nr:ATP-binding protein [Microtetraspora sp. NBRC 13810]
MSARSLSGLGPASVRGRITMLVTFIAILLLVPAALAGGQVARTAVSNGIWSSGRRQATLTAEAVRAHTLRNPITPAVAGIDLIQVVAPDRRVLAASSDAGARTPLLGVWPDPQQPERDVQACTPRRRACVRISALRVSSAPGSEVVYAGRAAPGMASTAILDGLFAVQALLLIALATWAAWTVTGRTLAPVQAIRGRLAEINGSDLSARVPEPAGEDEIAQLARTVNATLHRLEGAKAGMEHTLEQQRRFTADASHELRTPLTGLRIQLEEALMHPDEAAPLDVIKEALDDVERLQAIIADLLLLARIGVDTPRGLQPTDLAELVRHELARRVGDSRRIVCELCPDVRVNVLPVQISRLLTNLLDNAQRHAETLVRVEVRRAGRTAELTVTDDGPGIPPADREWVFQRFARLDTARGRDQGGTGLGLAIAREIAHAHHGTLRVGEPAEGGHGARFVLRLPLTT